MKLRRVKVDRNTILELYCRLFQVVQGLAGSSEFNWEALQRYYDSVRIAELRSIMERIRRLLSPGGAEAIAMAEPPAYILPDYRLNWRERLIYGVGGPFLVYCWPILNGLKSSWSFPSQELAYTLNRLKTFLQLLQTPGHPGYDKVVPLRMDLTACEWFIEHRCAGVGELEKVPLIEYFNKSPYVETIPLSAIINSSPRSAA